MEQTYQLVLCHHGVKGMKWGVRRERKAKLTAAKGKYQKRVSDAHDEYNKAVDSNDRNRQAAASKKYNDAVNKAKADYKSEKRKIKLDAKMKISEINKSPEGVIAGREAAVKALKTTGGVAMVGSAVAGVASFAVAFGPMLVIGKSITDVIMGK